MIVNINAKEISDEWIDVLNDIQKFASNELQISESKIEIKLYEDFSSFKMDEEVNGFLMRNGNKFFVKIATKKRNITKIAMTLIHELTHVMQYVHKGLKQDKSIPYRERWWEIEAREMEEKLLLKYMETI